MTLEQNWMNRTTGIELAQRPHQRGKKCRFLGKRGRLQAMSNALRPTGQCFPVLAACRRGSLAPRGRRAQGPTLRVQGLSDNLLVVRLFASVQG